VAQLQAEEQANRNHRGGGSGNGRGGLQISIEEYTPPPSSSSSGGLQSLSEVRAQLQRKEWDLQVALAKSALDAPPLGPDGEPATAVLPWAKAVVELDELVKNGGEGGGGARDERRAAELVQVVERERLRVDSAAAEAAQNANAQLQRRANALQSPSSSSSSPSDGSAGGGGGAAMAIPETEEEMSLDQLLKQHDEIHAEVEAARGAVLAFKDRGVRHEDIEEVYLYVRLFTGAR